MTISCHLKRGDLRWINSYKVESCVEVFPQDCGVSATLVTEEYHELSLVAMWHGFYALKVKDRIMNDALLLIATFAGTYLCSLAFVIILTRLIFPFKTREEMAETTIKQSVAQQRHVRKRTQIILPLLPSQAI